MRAEGGLARFQDCFPFPVLEKTCVAPALVSKPKHFSARCKITSRLRVPVTFNLWLNPM
jgi:hypothetical protein